MHKALKLTLSILTVCLGGAFWYLVGGFVSDSAGLLPLYALIDLVFFLALLGLSLIFLPYRWILFSIAAGILPIFYFLENYLLAFGIVVVFSSLILLPAYWIKKEAEGRVEFSVWETLRKGIPTLLTILALALAAFFYPMSGIVKFEDVIPRSVFDRTVAILGDSAPTRSLFPFDFPDPGKSVNDVLTEAIRLQAGDRFDQIPESEIERIVSQARAELARNLGVSSVEGSAQIGDVLYKGSIEFIEDRFGAYRRFLPAVFAIAIFAAFRTLFILLGPLSIALVWIITKILLYVGLINIAERQVVQRYIEVK